MSACLTNMITISIESFKLLLNEINQIENKNPFIIIREDALLTKGASNEEMASQDHHLHLCKTDTENTSLLVNNSNICLLSPRHIHDSYFCWGFVASFSLLHVFERRTLHLRWRLSLCCCGTLNTIEPLFTVAARSRVVSTTVAILFITNWWMSKIQK